MHRSMMTVVSLIPPAFLYLMVLTQGTTAFSPVHSLRTTRPAPPTRIFLEDWVADMIDSELHRLSHKKEFEQEWMEKNRRAVLSRIETDFVSVLDDDAKEDFRMYQRDKKMADKDPQRYCADRCVATGNCDVFEDYFDMTPEQVITFCTECVLSDDDEGGECDVPDAFYDKLRP